MLTKYDPRFWIPVQSDPTLVKQAEARTQSIAGNGAADAHVLALARDVAEARLDHRRACQARAELVRGVSEKELHGSPPSFANLVVTAKLKPRNAAARTILALDRYERRAASRCNKATHAFEAAVHCDEAGRTSPRGGLRHVNMEAPEPSPEVSANPHAARKWREAWLRLDRRRYRHEVDHHNLANYCLAYADWLQALGLIDSYAADGSETRDLSPNADDEIAAELPGERGLVENPYVKMAEDSRESMHRYGQQIGLAARASLSTASDRTLPAPDAVKEQQIVEPEKGAQVVGQPSKPGRRPFWTQERVLPALQEADRIFADAARILSDAYDRPCVRQTVSALVRRSPELQKVCEDAQAAVLDECYAGRVAKARSGNDHAQEYLLNHLDPRFRARHEVSGPRGGPIEVQVCEIEDERPGDAVVEGIVEEMLSPNEKAELANIARHVDAVGGIQHLPTKVLLRFKEIQEKGSVKADAPQIEGDNAA
jgi:phage terminase small subunit